ncbi:ribosome biogenesis GTP-binding protein YihA/YsxC [Mycoplasmopsis lipofaciens]|uniref:ribosome biogenesis GTP-binding protein YihA/YsxC n=1 Tax=Mycoplasmopsis lipofaciens TaxID=114884 RepID=UPI000480506E|nr:ribosome biogenesis GTP-binding protein YihA/YsxC [Mycoplasmopsis lipofaciens]
MWKFITSALEPDSWLKIDPVQTLVCFWGRSNVGKSSLLNSITNQNISYVSKHPGRTQLINYFGDINDKLIVDLPGYGFAKMSKEKQIKMNKYIDKFLENNDNKYIFLLIDSRTGITKIDLEKINYLEKINWPVDIIYTKIDKLNQKEKSQLIKKHNELFSKNLISNITNFFFVSSQKNINLNELVKHIDKILYNEH